MVKKTDKLFTLNVQSFVPKEIRCTCIIKNIVFHSKTKKNFPNLVFF